MNPYGIVQLTELLDSDVTASIGTLNPHSRVVGNLDSTAHAN